MEYKGFLLQKVATYSISDSIIINKELVDYYSKFLNLINS